MACAAALLSAFPLSPDAHVQRHKAWSAPFWNISCQHHGQHKLLPPGLTVCYTHPGCTGLTQTVCLPPTWPPCWTGSFLGRRLCQPWELLPLPQPGARHTFIPVCERMDGNAEGDTQMSSPCPSRRTFFIHPLAKIFGVTQSCAWLDPTHDCRRPGFWRRAWRL